MRRCRIIIAFEAEFFETVGFSQKHPNFSGPRLIIVALFVVHVTTHLWLSKRKSAKDDQSVQASVAS